MKRTLVILVSLFALVPSIALAFNPPLPVLADPQGVDQFTTEDCYDFYLFHGNMEEGEIFTGNQGGTGEGVVLVITTSTPLHQYLGLEPIDTDFFNSFTLREDVRVIEGFMVSTFTASLAEGLACPRGYNGNAWTYYSTDIGFLDEISLPGEFWPDQGGLNLDYPPNYQNPRYADFCPDYFLCTDFTDANCPPDNYNACMSGILGGGISACFQRAVCHLKECMRVACVGDRMCKCEQIKSLCDAYHDQTGEWPPPWWAPGPSDLNCALYSGTAAACYVIYALETTACVPVGCFLSFEGQQSPIFWISEGGP